KGKAARSSPRQMALHGSTGAQITSLTFTRTAAWCMATIPYPSVRRLQQMPSPSFLRISSSCRSLLLRSVLYRLKARVSNGAISAASPFLA
ncbi:hypothetical protein LPJ81_005937, partial [Coemansia sp. IMI 209127]